MIAPKSLYLVKNLRRHLSATQAYANGTELMSAKGLLPALGCYTSEQISLAAKDKKFKPITPFAIEIISDHDKINKVYGKLEEYFQAGVRVVWMIFPEFEKVYVYTSPEEVKICKGETLCSAEAVIPGFVISAGDLFKKD